MTSELEHYRTFFEWLHKEMTGLVASMPAPGLNWRPLPGSADDEVTNSLSALAAHVAGSQRYWVGEVAGGRPANRDRPAEFRVEAPSSQELQALLDGALALMREVLGGLDAGTLDDSLTLKDRTATRRWAIVHGLEHTALHLGHMQLTRQLWEARR
jgi:uncharacterized damage-inducible protein DinB